MGKGKGDKTTGKQPEDSPPQKETEKNNEITELKALVEVLKGRVTTLEDKVEPSRPK